MSLVSISKKSESTLFAPLRLGFRPFFLAAGLFGLFSMALWMWVYVFHHSLVESRISVFQWHAHEMVFGYAMAVVAGFLLTAVENWTGVATIRGSPLLALLLLWLGARIFLLCGNEFVLVAAGFDLLFGFWLLAAVTMPVLKARQWRQVGICSKLVLLLAANLSFYLGAIGVLDSGTRWGMYGGLYLLISLILTIGGRVMPPFITNGVAEDVRILNPRWIAVVTLVLFLAFFINELFFENTVTLGGLSLSLFVVTSLRLFYWHTPGIWKVPLLWSLYLAYVSITLGFALFAASAFWGVSKFIAIHAFAVGGLGLISLSMMMRVTLGHTGRSIKNTPSVTGCALVSICIGAVLRVAFPLFAPEQYVVWIFLAQAFWLMAFGLFVSAYARMLLSPRIDGRPG